MAASRSIFSQLLKPFPNTVEGKIATLPFLEGAKGIIPLVDMLGSVFAVVRGDMVANIEKLTTRFNQDSKKFEFLNDMVLWEKSEKSRETWRRTRATDALLWLQRALQFVHNFLFYLAEDFKANKKTEDLSPFACLSYSETLQGHHGFLGRRLFDIMSCWIPQRSQLLSGFSGAGKKCHEEIIFEEMQIFLLTLESNLRAISEMFEDNDLDPSKPTRS